MHLYNKNWTRRELEARVGWFDAIGGVRRIQYTEGPEQGMEMIQVRTGAGLTYYVNSMRALDIGLAEFAGVPLSWQSVNGPVHPAYFDRNGTEWLRTAAGGLLMTCGLTQVGAPGEDNGEALNIHGRVHHTPARQVAAEASWENDALHLYIGGVVEETKIFSEHLRMNRHIQSQVGVNRISIIDEVENIGFERTPHMILYHFNFGFPLLNEHTQLIFPSAAVTPRDEGTPVDGYNGFDSPEIGSAERVYYHTLDPDQLADDIASVYINQPYFPIPGHEKGAPLSVRLSWDTTTLPRLIQWRMHCAGTYAMGIEPANCDVKGRVWERENGTLQMLEPGEKRTYHLELEVSTT